MFRRFVTISSLSLLVLSGCMAARRGSNGDNTDVGQNNNVTPGNMDDMNDVVPGVCGNGVCEIMGGESCEQCPSDCGTLPGCNVDACGDGKLTGDEVCDDGNFDSFDGCSALCAVEPDYSCAGEPSVCGRAILDEGEIVITEIMPAPLAVADELGEWFEVYNNTADVLNLEGLAFADDDFTSFSVFGPLLVEPGNYLVFGNNADTTTNGGVAVDYEYAGMALDNDTERLTAAIVTNMGQSTKTVDEIVYGNGLASVVPGKSVSLDPGQVDVELNDQWINWCTGTTNINGDFGTPGAANPACPPPPPIASVVSDSMLGITIEDNGPEVTHTLTVSQPGCTVLAMDVDVDITHGYIGDVSVTLTSPNGTKVVLHDRSGGGSDDITGNYPGDLALPAGESFAVFSNTDPNGDWTIAAQDHLGGFGGTLNEWGLNIICQP